MFLGCAEESGRWFHTSFEICLHLETIRFTFIKSFMYRMKVMLSVNSVQIKISRILQAPSSLHQKDAKPNLEVEVFVDIKILWWIHNRPIVHDKIFVIKLISNWWCGWFANEIKPHGNIKWKKPYDNVKIKDLYGKFLLNEIPN